VYITSFRAFRRPTPHYAIKHALVFALIALGSYAWMALGVPGFWSFVVYFTIFHHGRQFYGILRWYMGLNRRADRYSEWFLYLLTCIPLIFFHFRPIKPFSIYGGSDNFFYPITEIYQMGIAL
ncbi:MAG: hypothetical protein N2578_09265, partial [Bdellovibrionaceae bacterium]|nr:hypothetical protein [Pseudobdellovibrionaceae bacterium]